ncbi:MULTISPECIES: hypothetical protein [Paenibacillus]|uniref:hypothetical protein n=1 Tax=Paenibacillus TaxID=44249 RepID=UPI000837B5B1|nr:MULTISPECIES: hypothetical protein [Paenibacillus]GIP24276.1 hypothetical protein J22TS3_45510 [Paenibacillus sp. J22TS3]
MRTVNPEVMTRNLLQFCYTCEDAHMCDCEEKCIECWAEKGMLTAEDNGVEETRALLQEYYA